MMSSMRTTDRPTDAFVELCKTLYGPGIDPEAVWVDVMKDSPSSADVNAMGTPPPTGKQKFVRGVAATGTGLGAVLGVSELGNATRKLAPTGSKLAAVASKIPALSTSPKVGLGVAAGALASDVLATHILAAKTPKPTPGQLMPTGNVAKMDVPHIPASIKTMAAGLRRTWPGAAKDVVDAAKPISPDPGTRAGVKAARTQAQSVATQGRGKAIGTDIGAMLGTTSGKVAAVGAAYGATKVLKPRPAPVSYTPDMYGKSDAAVEWIGEFSKFDDDKHLAFGWASVTKVNGQPVVDRQGDYISGDDLEDAAYAYVHNSRVGGDMHARDGEVAKHVSDMVESMVFTDEKVAKMGLPDDFPRGWWVGFRVNNPETWSEVRKKGRTGFSIHGRGLRVDQDLDELMGY